MGECGVECGVGHLNLGLSVELGEESLHYGEEFVDIATGLILHFDRETVGHRETGDHRRRKEHDAAVLDTHGRESVELLKNIVGAFALTTFAPVAEVEDERTVGGTLTGHERVTVDHGAGLDGGYHGTDRVDLSEHLTGALLRGARGHIDYGEYGTGVFVGHHTGRCDTHEEHQNGY